VALPSDPTLKLGGNLVEPLFCLLRSISMYLDLNFQLGDPALQFSLPRLTRDQPARKVLRDVHGVLATALGHGCRSLKQTQDTCADEVVILIVLAEDWLQRSLVVYLVRHRYLHAMRQANQRTELFPLSAFYYPA
jgi:hypothetical protein